MAAFEKLIVLQTKIYHHTFEQKYFHDRHICILIKIKTSVQSNLAKVAGWLEDYTSTFSTKIGYIGDKVLGEDLVRPR